MSNRTWIVIVVFGVGAVVFLGMSMQFVLKSSPGLQASIKFKQALARDFSSRGVQEVALRHLKKGSGYHLLLTANLLESETDRERLDEEVADYFVREHGDQRARVLKISYHPPRSWGCRSALAEPHRVKEISLPPLRRRIAREKKQRQLAANLDKQLGCTLLSCEVEGAELVMRVKIPPAEVPSGVTNLVRKIERSARGSLRGLYSTLRLLLVGDPSGTPAEKGEENGAATAREEVLFDGTFDRGGSRTKPTAVPEKRPPRRKK